MKRTLTLLIIMAAVSAVISSSCVKKVPTEPGYPTATPTTDRQVLYIDVDNGEAALTDLHCVDTVSTAVSGLYSVSKITSAGNFVYSDSGDLYMQNIDGTGNTRLTYGTEYEVSPSISGDGLKITYGGYTSIDGYQIWRVNSDSSGNTQLTYNAFFTAFPKWSPDGTKIAYITESQIQVMNEDGTNSRTCSTAGLSVYALDWSPDGTKFVFTCYDNGNADYRICTINSSGAGAITVLMSGPDGLGNINWVPAYNKIYYDSDASGYINIYRMDPDGSNNVTAIDPGSDVTFDYFFWD